MDQDLIAYLDAKFKDIDQRFESIDQRFESIDQRLESIDQRFDETQAQIRANRTEILKNRGRIEHAKVMVEGLRSEIQTVAEGNVMLDGKMDRVYDEIKVERQLDRGETRSSIRGLREQVERLEAAG